MKINTEKNGNEFIISIEGRLDTITAPELETIVKTSLEGIVSLVLDFSKLEYISSAGLRVVLTAQKIMNKHGKMVIRNVNSNVHEVFDITGFSDILTIE